MDKIQTLTSCPVLFQDEWLILVDKPAGVLSHPNTDRQKKGGTSSRAAFEGTYDVEKRCFKTPAGMIWLIHRLDQDTSGVLLAARDAATAAKCRTAFEAGEIRKNYTVLVLGRLPASDVWKDHLAVGRKARFVRTVVLTGKRPNALLRYRIAAYYPASRLSLLEIELVTGKTHQIRVQAAFRGYPVVGDDVYGNFAFNKKLRREINLRRLFLHASMMEIQHPVTGETLRVESPLPEALQQSLKQLH